MRLGGNGRSADSWRNARRPSVEDRERSDELIVLDIALSVMGLAAVAAAAALVQLAGRIASM